jgi:hypothetical protein
MYETVPILMNVKQKTYNNTQLHKNNAWKKNNKLSLMRADRET